VTDIEQARAVLAKWKDEAVQGPWKFNEDGWLVVGAAEFGGRFADLGGDLGGDLGTAALIVGTAGNPDLLDAIDSLLAMAAEAGEGASLATHGKRIAVAIIAADQRIAA
jgi:hypothetical protein